MPISKDRCATQLLVLASLFLVSVLTENMSIPKDRNVSCVMGNPAYQTAVQYNGCCFSAVTSVLYKPMTQKHSKQILIESYLLRAKIIVTNFEGFRRIVLSLTSANDCHP